MEVPSQAHDSSQPQCLHTMSLPHRTVRCRLLGSWPQRSELKAGIVILLAAHVKTRIAPRLPPRQRSSRQRTTALGSRLARPSEACGRQGAGPAPRESERLAYACGTSRESDMDESQPDTLWARKGRRAEGIRSAAPSEAPLPTCCFASAMRPTVPCAVAPTQVPCLLPSALTSRSILFFLRPWHFPVSWTFPAPSLSPFERTKHG